MNIRMLSSLCLPSMIVNEYFSAASFLYRKIAGIGLPRTIFLISSCRAFVDHALPRWKTGERLIRFSLKYVISESSLTSVFLYRMVLQASDWRPITAHRHWEHDCGPDYPAESSILLPGFLLRAQKLRRFLIGRLAIRKFVIGRRLAHGGDAALCSFRSFGRTVVTVAIT